MRKNRPSWLLISNKSSRTTKKLMVKNQLNKTLKICNCRFSLSTSNSLMKRLKVPKRQIWWVKCIKLSKSSKHRSLYSRSNWIRNRTKLHKKMQERNRRWMESQTLSHHFRTKSEIWISNWLNPEKSVTRDKVMLFKCSRLRPSSRLKSQYFRLKWTKS